MTEPTKDKIPTSYIALWIAAICLSGMYCDKSWEFQHFKTSCISHGYCHHDPSDGHLVWESGKDAPLAI